MILLLLIIYVVSITITQIAVEELTLGVGEDVAGSLYSHWGTLDRPMFTLLQSISGGLNWGDASDALSTCPRYVSHAFTVYIVFVYFAVLNIITGIFCSYAIETTQRNPDLFAHAVLHSKNKYV